MTSAYDRKTFLKPTFSPFPTMFSDGFMLGSLKPRIMWYTVKLLAANALNLGKSIFLCLQEFKD